MPVPEFNFTDFEIYQFINILIDSRPDFYKYAACKNQGIEKFFPGRGKSSVIKKAINICNFCPVQYECFEYAMKTQTEDGVWGGSTPEERTKFIKLNVSTDEAWITLNSKK
jgi:WhiB family redox-sensing transcriptional regulator